MRSAIIYINLVPHSESRMLQPDLKGGKLYCSVHLFKSDRDQ